MNIKIIYPQSQDFKPSNIAVSSARTCYFSGGLVEPSSSEGWKSKQALLSSIFEAGHHTTLQHTNITILIDGMSRHLIWRLLHSHPYYNSEQVSQRYAKMQSDSFTYPVGCDLDEWKNHYDYVYKAYEKMIELLEPVMKKLLPKFKQKESTKKAQEFARYLLPQGMNAYLYHTINLVTALRYIGSVNALPESQNEAKEFCKKLEEAILNIDFDLKPLIDYSKSEKVEYFNFNMENFKKSKDITDQNVKVFDVSDSVDFESSINYSSVLRFSQLFQDAGVLGGFSSYLKLSLSADAQNQRHRRSPAIRPRLEEIYKRDYYIPDVIHNNQEISLFYLEVIEKSYDFFEKQRDLIGFGEAVYALPNAHNIEIIERNDFSSFHHKAQMRLCYNAQQEIFDRVYEQIVQLKTLGVTCADKFLPPCTVRSSSDIYPICPEGARFCGIKVWKKSFEEIKNRAI